MLSVANLLFLIGIRQQRIIAIIIINIIIISVAIATPSKCGSHRWHDHVFDVLTVIIIIIIIDRWSPWYSMRWSECGESPRQHQEGGYDQPLAVCYEPALVIAGSSKLWSSSMWKDKSSMISMTNKRKRWRETGERDKRISHRWTGWQTGGRDE